MVHSNFHLIQKRSYVFDVPTALSWSRGCPRTRSLILIIKVYFHTPDVFSYSPLSYTSRDKPKSETMATLFLPRSTFLAARSRWTHCKATIEINQTETSWNIFKHTLTIRTRKVKGSGCRICQNSGVYTCVFCHRSVISTLSTIILFGGYSETPKIYGGSELGSIDRT